MKIKWIGQAGFLVEADEKLILIDPYLSDSVEKINPFNYRRQSVDKSLFDIKPDIIILTHNHLDHTDPDTLKHYISESSKVTVLASENAWQNVRSYGGINNNYVMFNRGTHWTDKNMEFYAVKAEHSDLSAIGVVIYYKEKTYYITGDTLYNEAIFADLPKNIDIVLLPINGLGNNMNIFDAKKFVKRINAKKAVPIHWGMFDEINPHLFNVPEAVIPEIYKQIEL